MRVGLVWKLLGLHVVVVVLVITAIWVSLDLLAADYFMTLMKKFHVDPVEVNEMFLWANRRSLMFVGAGALLLSTALALGMTHRILAPLGEIRARSAAIAAGDYGQRVVVSSNDELGDVGDAFNSMAVSLARMEKLRQQMVVDVAHELRTPLTNLRGHIEALGDGLVAPSKATFEVLHSELMRLTRLTEDLLRSFRDGLRRDTVREPVDLRVLIEDSVRMFEPRFARRGLRPEVELQALTRRVAANPDQLRQVFANLLQNCLRFAPPESPLRIRASQDEARVRLEFHNRGHIDGDDLPWLFEPYYRADKSRSRDTGGAGIGLAIVQSIIEAHGGRVGASSADDATCVWIELPSPQTHGRPARRPA